MELYEEIVQQAFGASMTGYGKERLALLENFLKNSQDLASGRIWLLEPKDLRFKHGETIAELKIPYHLGADDDDAVKNAILGLIAILLKRYEPPAGSKREASSAVKLPSTPVLKEKTFRTDFFVSNSIEKAIAIEALSSVGYIDSGMVSAWLGSEGHGKKFMNWAKALFEKALKDEARHGWTEKTSYLALLAIIKTIRKNKEAIKDIRIPGLSYEKADLVTGVCMFLALRSAVKDLFTKLKKAHAPYYSPRAELLAMTAITPKTFVAIPSVLLATSLNPYRITGELFGMLSGELGPGDGFSGMQSLISGSIDAIKGSSEIVELMSLQNQVISFRAETLKYLGEFDIPGSEAREMLYELYNEDRLIINFFKDSRLNANLLSALEEVRKGFERDPKRAAEVSSFQRFIQDFRKPGGLASILKTNRRALSDAQQIIEGFYACEFDDQIDNFTGPMRGYLIDRRSEFSQQAIKEEYERGSLYRFSVDDRPIIKELERKEEGQLFIDMKDFTRKTLKVKEIAMAEFMRENFYKPIMKAASAYGSGSGLTLNEHGIRLTNLLGDAAIFSGGITSLVEVARKLQSVVRRYKEELSRKLPPRKAEELIDEVHRRFEEKMLDIRKRREELSKNAGNSESLHAELLNLAEEEHRIENSYRDELEGAIQGELDAGLFITYGAKPEMMTIESNTVFGKVQVSIGEKINEAARGTGRNPIVRAKLEVLLENEKLKRKNKLLRYPFDIYIDRAYSVKMPPELEGQFEKLLANRKPESAKAMAHVMANEYYKDLKMIVSGEPFSRLRLISATTDIYNKGQALSAEALNAYMNENKGAKLFFEKKTSVAELDNSIREEFFFPSETLEFWFGTQAVEGVLQVEAFYKIGLVTFKGFENASVVYEMINPEGDFHKALCKHHIGQWLKDAKEAARDTV